MSGDDRARSESGGVRRHRRTAAAVAVLLVVVAVSAVAAFPSVAATICPRCYGMSIIADRLYAAPDPSPQQRAALIRLTGDARTRVSDFYGAQLSAPTILACLDEPCFHRIGGGGERGTAVLNRAVRLSPRGIDVVIAAHEMSHVELHHRLGSAQDRLPQWLDEGIAVVVADDRRYLGPPEAPDRCRRAPTGPLPVSLPAWLSAATGDTLLYADAACRVSRWLRHYDSPRSAMDQLVDRLRRGEDVARIVQ